VIGREPLERRLPGGAAVSARALRRPDACARISLEHGESLHGVAPEGPQGFLLVEETRPWGDTGALASALLPAALRERCLRAGLRALFIRRPGRYEAERRTCFVAHAGYDGGWLRRAVVDDVGDLLDVDLDAVARGEPPRFGDEHGDALVLACTHGRVDACCAELGRPVARELHAALGERVWQCSHLGGCRFAANVLVLPRGVLLGRLRPGGAVGAVRAALAGRPPVDHVRGRPGAPRAAQVAEAHLRRRLGLEGLHEVELLGQRALSGGIDEVALRAGDETWSLRLRGEPAGAARPHGCGDPELWTPEEHRVLSCAPTVDLERQEAR